MTEISPAAPGAKPRRPAMMAFIEACGWGDAAPVPLAGDASFRRYFRLVGRHGRAVVMDAPPPQEDVGPFVTVAALLRDLGLSAPEILAEDRTHGFLLIEDFGDDTYTRLIAAGADESDLYALAIDTIVALQKAVSARGLPDLPSYDVERLIGEAALLTEWYAPAIRGMPLAADAVAEYRAVWQEVLPEAEFSPPTVVLRDYHVDNLMVLPGRPGIRGCGLLDFQDAVCGAASYDVLSLLEDARRDVAPALRRAMTERYLAAFPALDRSVFDRSAAILAVQRNCKILGIFTRLWRRDGKPQYLPHIPRVWRLIEADLRHPALAPIGRWLDCHLPPAVRRAPAPDRAA